MPDASRRRFLTGTAAAAASLTGPHAAHAVSDAVPGTAAPADPAAVLAAFGALAGTGLTREQIETSRTYLLGVYRELDAKLRPLELPDAVAPPVIFAAVKRP
jgi:hypothetical protein